MAETKVMSACPFSMIRHKIYEPSVRTAVEVTKFFTYMTRKNIKIPIIWHKTFLPEPSEAFVKSIFVSAFSSFYSKKSLLHELEFLAYGSTERKSSYITLNLTYWNSFWAIANSPEGFVVLRKTTGISQIIYHKIFGFQLVLFCFQAGIWGSIIRQAQMNKCFENKWN